MLKILLVYTTQVNSTFRARWLVSSEVISQVLFTIHGSVNIHHYSPSLQSIIVNYPLSSSLNQSYARKEYSRILQAPASTQLISRLSHATSPQNSNLLPTRLVYTRTKTNNDARAHDNNMKLLICKTEPTLQLSLLLQHQISQVTSDPTPSLQIGLVVLSHRSCSAQPLRNICPTRALTWSLMHWSSVGGYSELVSLQSFHDLKLEHEWHSKLDAANKHWPGTRIVLEAYLLILFSNNFCKIERN